MYEMVISEDEKKILIDMCDVFLRQTGLHGIQPVNQIMTKINQAQPVSDQGQIERVR